VSNFANEGNNCSLLCGCDGWLPYARLRSYGCPYGIIAHKLSMVVDDMNNAMMQVSCFIKVAVSCHEKPEF